MTVRGIVQRTADPNGVIAERPKIIAMPSHLGVDLMLLVAAAEANLGVSVVERRSEQ